MIISFFHRLLWALLLLAVQVLVLSHIHPWGFGAPDICPLLLVALPLGTSRSAALLWGFGLGFVTDVFVGTPGIGSAAMTLTALLQPPLLEFMAPRDSDELLRPSFRTMGRWNHTWFMAQLFLVHHIVFFALEGFSYYHIVDILLSMLVSYVGSMLLALIVERVRNPKES